MRNLYYNSYGNLLIYTDGVVGYSTEVDFSLQHPAFPGSNLSSGELEEFLWKTLLCRTVGVMTASWGLNFYSTYFIWNTDSRQPLHSIPASSSHQQTLSKFKEGCGCLRRPLVMVGSNLGFLELRIQSMTTRPRRKSRFKGSRLPSKIQTPNQQKGCAFWSTGLPLARTRWVWSTFSSHCLLSSSQCR